MSGAARARGGALIVENTALLAGGPNAFEQRYNVPLADDSFRKPGNNKVAFPLLHFLLCTIAPDDAQAFKPCFPVRDREQERDFKRVVDERLAVLERSRQLPLGVARKSTVAAAGGDKFEQLVWTLSTFALKEAALRHPAFAGHASNPDPKPSTNGDTAANRKYAALLRSRIASERAAFARTSQMGRDSTARWTNEISQLKERIALVAQRATQVKSELANLGVNDVDDALPPATAQAQAATKIIALKTSPIESDESTSVDEADSDLPRLLAFNSQAPGLAKDAEEIATAFENSSRPALGSDISASFPQASDSSRLVEPSHSNVVDLMQAAVEELEKAASRMNTIAKQQSLEISDISRDPSLETVDTLQPSSLTQEAHNSLDLHQAIVQSTRNLADTAQEVARDATESAKVIDNQSPSPLPSPNPFIGVRDSQELTNSLLVLSHAGGAAPSSQGWISDVIKMEPAKKSPEEGGNDEYSDGDESGSFELMEVDTVASPPRSVDSKADFLATVEDLQKANDVMNTVRKGQQVPQSQLIGKPPSGKKSSIKRKVENHKVRIESDVPFHQVPVPKVVKRKKSTKTVRFAELPPSYSASRAAAARGLTAPLVEPEPPEESNAQDTADPEPATSEPDDTPEPGSPAGSEESKDQDDESSRNNLPLMRDESYVTPPTAGGKQRVGARHRPVTRKSTPRHLATRRANAIRNVISDRADSSVNTAKQPLKKTLLTRNRQGITLGNKPRSDAKKVAPSPAKVVPPPAKVAPSPAKVAPSPAKVAPPPAKVTPPPAKVPPNVAKGNPASAPSTPSNAKTSADPPKPEPSPATNGATPTPSSNVELDSTPVAVNNAPPTLTTEKSVQKPAEKRSAPTSAPRSDAAGEKPSIQIVTEHAVQVVQIDPSVSGLYEISDRAERKHGAPVEPKAKSAKPRLSDDSSTKGKTPRKRYSSANEQRRFSTATPKAKKKTTNAATKRPPTTPSASASAEASIPQEVRRIPAVERVDFLSDMEHVEPRRSISSPDYVPQPQVSMDMSKSRESSGTTLRLISFPSLYGKRKEKDRDADRGRAGRRVSISSTGGSPFSWRNGGDRRSNVGRGETYHTPSSASDSGGASLFRTSSLFSSGRRSSVFGRRRTLGTPSGSGRKERESTSSSPRPSRVRALKERIAALL